MQNQVVHENKFGFSGTLYQPRNVFLRLNFEKSSIRAKELRKVIVSLFVTNYLLLGTSTNRSTTIENTTQVNNNIVITRYIKNRKMNSKKQTYNYYKQIYLFQIHIDEFAFILKLKIELPTSPISAKLIKQVYKSKNLF